MIEDHLFHGTSYEKIISIAEDGYLEALEFEEEDIFPSLQSEKTVYGKDKGVWVTESRSCVENYSWGGGYLVIDASDLKVVSDRERPYSVIPSEVGLENISEIRLEENQLTSRDYLLEIGSILESKGHPDINLKEYQGPEYLIAD